MEIPIKQLKQILDQFENTVYPDDQHTVIVPILLDYADLNLYDREKVNVHNIYFTKVEGVWKIQI